MNSTPRQVLERLCAERGDNFASLSRMIGRNAAYVQQYLRKGTPKQLGENERRMLARHFRIPESMLGGPSADPAAEFGELVPVPRTAVRTSTGPGALSGEESVRPYFAFDPRWLKSMTRSLADSLSVIRIEGDSMAPTLNDGDDILVDLADGPDRLRDGIYVLRVDGALLVKRLAIHPVGRRLTVQSDNPAYIDLPDCGLDEIDCIGRVIWAARRVA
ncbi:S24 family peptidase [Sphingomonas sp. RB56-2]|uniref:S24 family peptidase n=1 Tax=Sphingomonas brevis TaxID=2908206 RepID=A0ABT0S7X8_9SPHN|nr:S24 family peptidase [Sphingomonas brevis]MCL6740493.1 S24 family peptidase [Sphingomonas brevis]